MMVGALGESRISRGSRTDGQTSYVLDGAALSVGDGRTITGGVYNSAQSLRAASSWIVTLALATAGKGCRSPVQ